MNTEEQLRQRTKYMMDVLTRNEANIRQFNGVLAMGIGFREKRGESTLGEPCIYVEVKKKLPVSELDPSQLLPEKIEDIPVDVVELMFIADLSGHAGEDIEPEIDVLPDKGVYRPMLSGCQVTDGITGVGTAGVMGYSAASSGNNLGFLTCKHVLPRPDKNIVYQPGPAQAAVATVIFRAYELIPGQDNRTQLDIAVCQLNSNIKANNQLAGERAIFTLSDDAGAPYLEQPVIKYGRTTRLTSGIIRRLGRYIPGTEFHTEMAILDDKNNSFGPQYFSEPGDSGAALLTTEGGVLGIVAQRYFTHPFVNYTNVNDIRYIKSKLGNMLKFPIPDSNINMIIAEDTPRLNAYARMLSKTEEGSKFLRAFLMCYPEGRELIMHNRECMVTWIRMSGPEFVMLRKKRFSSDHYELVKQAGGHTITELLARMFEVFVKHGTDGFKMELQKYRDVVLDSFKGADTLEQVVIRLSELLSKHAYIS